MNLEMAIQTAAHAYPGGLKALAGAMCMRYDSLKHKVSVTYTSAHLSPSELAMLIDLVGPAPLHALCSGAGYVAMPLPAEPDDDDCVVAELAEAMHEDGQFAATTSRAYSDRRFDAREMAAIERDALDAITAKTRVVAAARKVFNAGRTPPERRVAPKGRKA
nr:phage regulatory CII family protein [Variovorax boronicumulans]